MAGSLVPPLPIDEVVPSLRRALARARSVVLQAPPGAGKTTRVPLALLHEPWLGRQRILMLEPRRLAARAAARRMAMLVGESVGGLVGFRVRGESRVSRDTRIEVVTEGILTRLLQDDPSLDGLGLLVFDEFHERSLHADLGLALSLETQSVLRPELRILVMSATLDGAAVAALLGDAPVVSSVGRAHPVAIRHVPRRTDQSVDAVVAATVRQALASDAGSVLAFLPGAAEIRRARDRLLERALPSDVRVYPLYGDLSLEEQDAAISSPPGGTRKVVLATSIAETSLTIEDVRIVVDSGLARVPSFDPRSGMSSLRTINVSRASAEQRRGRAGRTAPGVCYRLWAVEEHAGLLERATPEIADADLVPLALDLARVGIADPGRLRWLDAPPAPALAHARDLLTQLGALDADGRITSHGVAMSRLGTHPRLAHMLVRGRAMGIGASACVGAALLEERDVLRRDALHREPDVRVRIAAMTSRANEVSASVDPDAVRRARDRARIWRSQLGIPASEVAAEADAGVLIALAYPDRVAQRRVGSADRYLTRGGLGAVLVDRGSLGEAAFIAIAEVDGQRPDSRVFLAAPLERTEIDSVFGDQVIAEDVVAWRDSDDGVVAVRRERLGAIVLRESPLREVDDDAVALALLETIVQGETLRLSGNEASARLRARLAFLHAHFPGWPDVSDRALATTAPRWLLPHLVGLRRRRQVAELDVEALLRDMLTWEQRARLEQLAPTHVDVPSGSRIRVDYEDPATPVLAVRLQELFGLSTTPSVGGGAVPLTLHLLSPANRPVQVTRDLAGFWRGSYFDVRKDLRGRYPKHEWPEDPLGATPTRRAKPRR